MSMELTEWQKGAKAALEYAAQVCDYRKASPLVGPGFKAGCEDVQIFIEAALERTNAGEVTDGKYFASQAIAQ